MSIKNLNGEKKFLSLLSPTCGTFFRGRRQMSDEGTFPPSEYVKARELPREGDRAGRHCSQGRKIKCSFIEVAVACRLVSRRRIRLRGLNRQ